MKLFKKAIILFIAIAGFASFVYSAPLGVDTIEVKDPNTLSVMLSENPNLSTGEIEAEITILHDVKLRGGFLSDETSDTVELILEDPILPNTNYSLLTVVGAEGSIDFTTPAGVEGYVTDKLSAVSEQDIGSIEIIDDRTINIVYNSVLTSSTYEYKLLAEATVTKVEKNQFESPELTISVEPPFKASQDYILMFIEMQDVDGNFLEFDTGIYDFSTDDDLEEVVQEESGTGSTMTGSTVEETPEESTPEVENTNTEEEPELNAAGNEETTETGSGQVAEDIETVASAAEVTPDTGAETWVLIALTLIINTIYYSARRKRLNLA